MAIFKKREPFVEIAMGETGVGKTHQTLKKVFNYVQKNNRPVIVIDFQDEYTKAKCGHVIPTIDCWPNKRKKWNGLKDFNIPEVRRVRPLNQNGTRMNNKEKSQALYHIITQFKNGLIIIDDLDKYAVFDTSQDMTGVLMGNRQPGLDIIITHQSFGVLTTMECRNLQVVRLHHTSDSPRAIKEKLQDNLEVLEIAYYIVKDQYEIVGNHRYFMYINVRKKKLWGCSQKTFEIACQKYIFKQNLISNEIQELIFYGIIDKRQKNTPEAEQKAKSSILKKLERYYSPEPVIVNN